MPDLTYNDVQRAVQDGLRQMLNDVHNIGNASERIDDIERHVIEMHHMMQEMHRIVLDMRPHSSADSRLARVADDMTDLKQRFVVIEKFAQQMSDYAREQYDADREDRQYRST